ncbi:MAG: cyclic nucleotide-binding and patatin-like phospholipase domain-containing protein [Cyanobacteria bacterium P01_F01_bin.153]
MNEEQVSLLKFLWQSGFAQAVEEKDLERLVEIAQISTLPSDHVLIREGEREDTLYLLWEGQLQIYREVGAETPLVVGAVQPGEWVGELPVVLGGDRIASVRTMTESRIASFSKEDIQQLYDTCPAVQRYFLDIALQKIKELNFTMLLHKIFDVLEPQCINEFQQHAQWLQLDRGDRLFAQGDEGDGLYFVLNGRLNVAIQDAAGSTYRTESVTSGELIGEMSILADEPRSASVYAARSSTLIHYGRQQFKDIIEKYPALLLKVTRNLIGRFRQREQNRGRNQGQDHYAEPIKRHIAVVPHSGDVPLKEFSRQLAKSLGAHGRVLHLSRQYLSEVFGFLPSMGFAPGGPQELRFQLWLESKQEDYDLIFFEADSEADLETDPDVHRKKSSWTQFCLGQVDHVVLVANSQDDPQLSAVEKQIESKRSPLTGLKSTLVLLHSDTSPLPRNTRSWLAHRNPDIHHHVRWFNHKDVERVGRFLTDRAIGLALGGGGSRGAAHIGILKALEEKDIPVDFIGGTSIGGLVAAQYAMGLDVPAMVQANKEAIAAHNPFKSYTIPVISLLQRGGLDGMLKLLFDDIQIEDLWLNFFCVSTNICGGEKVVHRTGDVWKAVRATSAVPGLFAPFLDNGNLLIDGACMDNDPSITMGEVNSGPILLSSVSPQFFPKVEMEYEELPSSFKILWSWICPGVKPVKIPSLLYALGMSTAVNSAGNLKRSFSIATVTFSPPLDDFRIFDFTKIDEIVQIAYEYALQEMSVEESPATRFLLKTTI